MFFHATYSRGQPVDAFPGGSMWPLSNLSKTSQAGELCRSLSKLGVSFQGPLRTPKGQVIFLIEGGILLESELLSLCKGGQFTRESVVALAENTLR